MAKQIAASVALLLLTVPVNADCGHFFRQKVVVQQQVAVPVVVQQFVPLIYYAAGQDLQLRVAIRRELEDIQQAPLKGAYQSPQQAPIQAPVKQQPLQQVAVGTFAKCARCHTGDKPAGGLTLDGRTPTTCENYRRFGEIFALHENIPTKMQAVVSSLTPDEAGAINEAILRLIPVAVQPTPPAPVPDGGLQ